MCLDQSYPQLAERLWKWCDRRTYILAQYVRRISRTMSFGEFRLKPKPEHISAVLSTLRQGTLLTPQEIAVKSSLTLSQVKCVLNHLESTQQLRVVRQETAPRVRVALLE